jgi:hypothetical protein
VGKAALEGLPGVEAVSTGWKHGYEANEVRYDPQKVDVKTMEQALRKASTYIKTLESE